MNKVNKIILEEDWGFFIGRFNDNNFHRHYAIQINIPLYNKIDIKTDKKELDFKEFSLIPSNYKHKIKSEDLFLIILINPLEFLYDELKISKKILPIVRILKINSINYAKGKIDDESYVLLIKNTLKKIISTDQIKIDHRIEKGLNHLKKNKDRVVSLSEISNICHLSESRFIHLFKSELKITFRRAQLWYRVSHSFTTLFEKSITETAYEFGFSDSSHYSRTFKENFGFSPRDFLKNSQFIQV